MKKLIIAAALLALLVAACDDGPDETEELAAEATTPALAINNVTVSFNSRDVAYLERVMAGEFVFHFNPDDVGQNPPGGSNYVIPESWGYAEFRYVILRMYKSAYSIDLAIPTGSIGEPAESAEIYRAENVTISFLVMIDELNGYIANQGYCVFEFEKYYENGEGRWRLTGWWDNTATACDEPTSVGRILAHFR
ncbi:MAG: hypothetical protein PVH29_02470 [Candidatus Zixiibacteriota bacterium]|jgi:hypothetical protein